MIKQIEIFPRFAKEREREYLKREREREREYLKRERELEPEKREYLKRKVEKYDILKLDKELDDYFKHR